MSSAKAGRRPGRTRGGPDETLAGRLLVYVRVPDVVLEGEPELGAEDNLAALFNVKILLYHLGDP